MKFYNPFKINEDRLTTVEEQLTKFSEVVQGHGELWVELTVTVKGLRADVTRLRQEVGELRRREQALRTALSEATRTDPAVDDND